MAGYGAHEQRFVRIETDISELKHDVSELKRDVYDLKRDVLLLKWMLGFVLAFQVATLSKLFLH